LTLTEYIINLTNTYVPFPYNIGASIIILCVSFLVLFYYKHNKEKVKKMEKAHYGKIISAPILIIILTFGFLGGYYMWVHGSSIDHPNPDIPNNHFRVAISPFYLSDEKSYDLSTPKHIKEEINASAGDNIEVVILNQQVKNDSEAKIQGDKVSANFVVYGGNSPTLAEPEFETKIYVVPVNRSLNTQLFLSKNLLKNNDNERLSLDNESGSIIFSPHYYTNHSIILDSITNNVPSCVYTICAFAYFTNSNFDSAIALFEKVNNYEKNADVLFYIGESYGLKGNFNESLKFYNNSIEINPNLSEAWYGKGNVLLFSDNPIEAIKMYDQATKIDPNNSEALCSKGVALFLLNNHEEALKTCDRLIEIDANNPIFWCNKGMFLFYSNKYNESIEAYDKSIQLDQNMPLLWKNKENALFNLNMYEEVLNFSDKAILIFPNDPDFWDFKGVAYYKLNKYKESLKAYDKAIQIDQNDSVAWLGKGEALSSLNKQDEALNAYDRAIQIDQNNSVVWESKGSTLLNLGKHEEAIKAYDKAIGIDRSDSVAWLGKGVSFLYLNNSEDALYAFDKAIQIDQNFSLAWECKGHTLLIGLNKSEEALKAYDRAIQIDKNNSGAWFGKSKALSNLNKSEESLKAYDRATQIDQNDSAALDGIITPSFIFG